MADDIKSPAIFGAQYIEKFRKGQMVPPSDVHPEKEDPKFYLAFAEWIYGQYCNGFTEILPGGYLGNNNMNRSIAELRAYGRGEQPIQKYKNSIDVSKIVGPDGKRIGLVNISWDTMRVWKKFREIIIDRLMSVEHEPGVVAIDTPSLRKKQLAYAKDRLAAMAQSKMVYEQAGMLPDGVNEDVMKMTPVDVDILNQMGGYKILSEIALSEAAQASILFSNYDPEIKRQLDEDLVDIGIMATHQKYDPASGRLVIEYVDPAGLVIPSSEYDDCRDIDYSGFLKMRSISYLRQTSDLTEAQLMEIAKKYAKIGSNVSFSVNASSFEIDSRTNFANRFTGNNEYDQFQCQVMTVCFTAMDVERYVVGYRPEGNRIFDKVSRESELRKRDVERGKDFHDNVVQYTYKCDWIVGTNIVFNCGVDDVVVREGTPGAMRATPPVAVYRSNQGSITAACIGAIDDLQIAVLRKRHALTVMPPPPNIAVDMAIMEDSVNLGPLKLDPLDLMDIYSVTGILYYHSKSEFAGMNEGSNRPPMSPLGDGVQNYLLAMQKEVFDAMEALRMISGVNEIADGTGNPKDVLNGVAAGAETASNRSISALYTACTSHYKSMVNKLIRGYQSVASYGAKKIHYLPVGSDVVRLIELYPDFALNEMDVTVKPGQDRNSRQYLMEALVSNRENQKIGEDVYLMVLNLIQEGNLKRAQFVMAKAVSEKAAQDQQNQIALMKEQSAAQGEQAKVTEQAKQASMAMEGEIKSKQIVLEAEEGRKTEELKHTHRMTELGMQAEITAKMPASTGM